MAGSETEARAKKAQDWIESEIEKLVEVNAASCLAFPRLAFAFASIGNRLVPYPCCLLPIVS